MHPRAGPDSCPEPRCSQGFAQQSKGAALGSVNSRMWWEQRSINRGTAWIHGEGRAAHYSLHGLMLVLPMPGKLPPPHPLLLAHKHFLTLHSTGMREGIQVSIPSRTLHPPEYGWAQSWGCNHTGFILGELLHCGTVNGTLPPFLSSPKNKVPPAHLKRQNA